MYLFLDHQFANSLLLDARMTAEASTGMSEDAQPCTSRIKNVKFVNYSLPSPQSDLEENIPANPQNTKITNVWSYNQTVHLIKSMSTFYSDFNDPRKRKHIFENISNDLISAGYTVDSKMVQAKWKGLLRSYTKAKDNKNRTGQGPSRFLFYEIIDDIVGNLPKNSCSHSLNTLDTPETFNRENEEPLTECESEETNLEVEFQNNENKSIKEQQETRQENKKRKRLSENQIKKEYIDLRREEYEKRQKRHEEKCLLERERNEIDRRKVEILEEYLKVKLNRPP